MMKSKTIRRAIGLSLILLAAACMKKRPDEWAQGEGRYLEPIGSLDGKVFGVKTYGKVARAPNSQSVSEPKVEGGVKGSSIDDMLLLDQVAFDTKATLLPKNVPFRAREFTSGQYQIMYQVTDKYVKVMK